MVEPIYQQHILDTIDHLRHRKARPDSERIFHALTKKYAVAYDDAKIALERAVQNGSVLRVEYKGSISYRNAAKKAIKREENSACKTSRKFTGLVTNSIAELVLQEPDYLQWGVPAEELVKNILSKDSVKYTTKYVQLLLDKEVEGGGLIRMENGNFLVGPEQPPQPPAIQPVTKNTKPAPMVENVSAQPMEMLEAVVKVPKKRGPKPGTKFNKSLKMDEDSRSDSQRVGGRPKKVKKMFDPSDNSLRQKKRGRPAGSLNKTTLERKRLSSDSEPRSRSRLQSDNSDSRPQSRSSLNGVDHGGVCSVCHNQNKKGLTDKMISCRECSNKAHSSCLNNGDMMLRTYPDNTWQCPHCKTCAQCFETGGAVLKGSLAVCSVCADAYHKVCHEPKLTNKIMSESIDWKCKNCSRFDMTVTDLQLGFGKVEKTENNNSDCSDDEKSIFSDENSTSRSNFPSYSSTPTPTISMSPPRPEKVDTPIFEAKFQTTSYKNIKVDEYFEENFDPSIPDATNWSYDEVYKYFRQFFNEEEAKIFKDHEIDGRSLLLLRRADILQCFKLKLGVALKIFKHVVKLQYRRDDPRLYWL